MKLVSITLDSSLGSAAVELKVLQVLEHEHIASIGASHISRYFLLHEISLPNAVNNSIKTK